MARHLSLDGFTRTKTDDLIISRNIESLFRSPTGEAVLQYLRSITIEAVSGPNISADELRHLEGQRYLVGLIERRMKQSEKAKDVGNRSTNDSE
tara:strand:- start:2377 stop:2658 length:282 start_codon:yes stop_codon:yes gene_type:complete